MRHCPAVWLEVRMTRVREHNAPSRRGRMRSTCRRLRSRYTTNEHLHKGHSPTHLLLLLYRRHRACVQVQQRAAWSGSGRYRFGVAARDVCRARGIDQHQRAELRHAQYRRTVRSLDRIQAARKSCCPTPTSRRASRSKRGASAAQPRARSRLASGTLARRPSRWQPSHLHPGGSSGRHERSLSHSRCNHVRRTCGQQRTKESERARREGKNSKRRKRENRRVGTIRNAATLLVYFDRSR